MEDLGAVPLKIRAESYYYNLKDRLRESEENKYKLIISILKAYKSKDIIYIYI